MYEKQPLTSAIAYGKLVSKTVAHAEGRYIVNCEGLKALYDGDQILFKYCDVGGNITDEANHDDSIDSFAGICNAEWNIFGMMPHPERAEEAELGGTDGKLLIDSPVAASHQVAIG